MEHAPTKRQIQGHKREAVKEFREIILQAKEHREQFLEQRAEYWSCGDDEKKSRILKNIKRAEAQKTLFNKLSDVRGTTSVSPVQSLSIPTDPTDPSGPWHTIHDHETISEKLMENKSDHFTQATGTPFTDPSLRIPLGRHTEHGVPEACVK